MPKRPRDPRRVNLTPVKRGDKVLLPSRDGAGPYVKERAPEHGLYMTFDNQETGMYVTARQAWDALDLVIDIEDRDK